MAETRNTFIKSRMNKDLDARILPKGEYRDALNVAISRSNEDTVGALENVLGNSLVTSFGIETFLPRNGSLDPTLLLNIISTDANWGGSSPVNATQQSTTGSGFGSSFTVTVAGGSATQVKSNGAGGGYSVGDQIVIQGELGNGNATVEVVSVINYCFDDLEIIGAKEDEANNRMFVFITNFSDDSFDNLSLTPTTDTFNFICVYDFNLNTPYILAKGKFLNFSKLNPIIGINVIENHLFWTDNRNQPRKLNIDFAINNPNYYDNYEHNISVAKLAPIDPIPMVYTFNASGEPATAGTTYSHTTMVDATSSTLPDETTSNPFYDSNYSCDEEYTKERFLSFAYRYKYDDNEYSLISPFTQTCFIPHQDGFFIKTVDGSDTTKDDTVRAWKSTEVEFMTNKVNKMWLPIPLPFPTSSGGAVSDWSTVKDVLHIKEVDIIVKESDGISFKKLETIDIETIQNTQGSVTTPYLYLYTGDKPYNVLPTFEYTRVSDITPLRAVSQEVVGNRIVYGNYIDKHTTPLSLNFEPVIQEKSEANEIEYQNQTLKQNRNYQVGIVLQDLYGRQSSVILSEYLNNDGAQSSIFNPYRYGNQGGTVFANGTNFWRGDTLALDWKSAIPDLIPQQGYPGLYDGNVGTITYNPLGWVSYKVVVKQSEQDYYNVYYPGLLSGYINPSSNATQEDPIGHFVLHGDNINKIPRDLNAVGPTQNLFKSINVDTKAVRYNKQMEWVDKSYYRGMKKGGYEDGIFGIIHDQYKVQVDKEVTDKEELNQIYSDEWERLATQLRDGEGNIPDNSSVKLFPRVINTSGYPTPGNEQFNFADTAVGNLNYRPDVVVTIGSGTQLSLYQLPPNNTDITEAPEFYNFASDPLIARTELGTKFLNTAKTALGFPIPGPGFSIYGVPSSHVNAAVTPGTDPWLPTAGDMTPTLAIHETKAALSNLDIFYETTTNGYISDLNTSINAVDTTSVTNLYDNTKRLLGIPVYTNPINGDGLGNVFSEDSVSASAIVVQDFILANGTTPLTPGANGAKIFLARNKIGDDLTKYFTVQYVGVSSGADVYRVNTQNNYKPVSYGDERDFIDLFLECTNSTSVTYKKIPIIIKNVPPTVLSPTTTSGAPHTQTWNLITDGYNTPIITMYGTNGSSNTDLYGQNCFWEINGSDDILRLFELTNQKISTNNTYFNSNEISLQIKNTVTAKDVGTYVFSVNLKDRDYTITNPAIYYFSITIAV